MYSDRVRSRQPVAQLPRWLQLWASLWYGEEAVRRCENCGAQMALTEEAVLQADQGAVYGVRAWDCERCEHRMESTYVVTWPCDV